MQHKKIGLVGGLSWQSTAFYYQYLNRYFSNAFSPQSGCNLVIESVNFSDIKKLQDGNRWDEITSLIDARIRNLVLCGAQVIAICSNTTHKIFGQLKTYGQAELVSITDATIQALENSAKLTLVLGTSNLMTSTIYRSSSDSALKFCVPDKKWHPMMDEVIFSDIIGAGDFTAAKRKVLDIIDDTRATLGIDSILLACTELNQIMDQEDIDIMLKDSATTHCDYLIQKACTLPHETTGMISNER